MKSRKRLISSAVVVLFVTVFIAWGAEAACTPIGQAGYTISSPGLYCLNGNVTYSSNANAVTINADNVVLDLNGYKIEYTGSGYNVWGIAAVDHKNITIRNGTIKGFAVGIRLTYSVPLSNASRGNVVENILADGNREVGILVMGTANIIRNNRVTNTLGPGSLGVYGIILGSALGGSAETPCGMVINNDVYQTTDPGPGGSAFAIFVNCNGAVVENNRVENSALAANSYGIHTNYDNILVVNNRIVTMDYGVHFNDTGKYRDNLTINVTNPYYGGTDAGNNQ